MRSMSCEGEFLGGPVFGADGLGAFEGHVLEHVGEAGAAFGVVDGAGVDVGVEGDHGRLVAFEDDEVHAVGEGEFGDALLEFLEVLGGQDRGQSEWEEEVSGFHVGYLLYILPGGWGRWDFAPRKNEAILGMWVVWRFRRTEPWLGWILAFDRTNPICVDAVVPLWDDCFSFEKAIWPLMNANQRG